MSGSAERSRRGGPASGGGASGGSVGGVGNGQEPSDYEGPGAWGPAALWLLGTLFVLSAIATVHSILATFGGG